MNIIKIYFLLALITLSFSVSSQNLKTITLEDFVTQHTFKSETVDKVKSMNDGEHFTSLKDKKSIAEYSYKTGEETNVIFSLDMVEDCPVESITDYELSNDEQRILIESNKKSIYRRSYTAEYYVWDNYTEKLYPVSDYGPQQVATFSPNGERIAFVRDNNIFIKTIRFGTELQVTNDGEFNKIINGVPDWVYEEEFSYNKAFSWSPDSKMLAFVKFNETDVKEFSIPMYKGLAPEKEENRIYTGSYTYKYPKAGEKNSEVSVHVFDIKTRTTIKAETGEETDIYIPRLKWTPDANNLAIFRLNRLQNKLDLLYANPYTGLTRTVFTEENKKFIDENFLDFFTYLEDNEHFVILSERDGWAHLYLYKNTGFFEKQLTSGNFDVTDFYGYDPDRETFYFQAAKKSPLQREVYAFKSKNEEVEEISQKEGTNTAIFSKDYKYYINFFSNNETPEVVTLFNNRRGKAIRKIEDNSDLKEALAEYELPSHEFFQFTTSEGIVLNGYMLKPSDFDPDKKYPVVISQYSGPNSQEVRDKWKIDWHSFLAGQGYVIAFVDPRGTAARGEDFRKSTYMQLGKLESEDQVEAAKYLASLSYIDEGNIGIWGWSFGGFTTALSLSKGGELFKAGVAVAPVTNWRYYDTVYTERYMRTPQQNPDGYDDNSPINNVEGIKSNLLIIHGTADDNVHAQNTYEYSEALVQAGIQFDMHMYTNRNHSISGGNTRMHLFNKIFNYFETHLKQ
ncbi:MAG: S9 family peptidase [Prolixibacteraceae bacterium]|jgi:dipeptidyl-peptidase-4|nr:S9 family peptidase [Prolixibacteraceae bacterium]